jgi:hypothetical protein
MTKPYIQSVTLNVPSDMVSGRPKDLKALFKTQCWGNYFQYGYYSLIMIDLRYFNPSYSIFNQITPFFGSLQSQGILSPHLNVNHLKLHEIKLRFDLDIAGGIFCKTGEFLKVDNATYRSNDAKKITRKSPYDNNQEWSKGRQISFVTVVQHDDSSSVILSFSGKYRKHISLDILNLEDDELIRRLCSIGSIYLSHAANPESFKVARGYKMFFPQEFQKMLNDANWDEDKFKRKNITSNFLRGVLL